MTQIDKHARYRGAMLAHLMGDAGGAKHENKRWEAIRVDLESQGGLKPLDYTDPWGGKRQMPAGHPTDDSELAACVAQAFLSDPGFNPDIHYQLLRGFIIERRTILAPGEAYGSGGTLRRALSEPTYALSRDKFNRGEVRIVPSNGALMRMTPVALRYHGRLEDLIYYARWQSCITHMHPLSQAACIAYCVLVHLVLDGHSVPFAWEVTKELLCERVKAKKLDAPELETVLNLDTSIPSDREIWGPVPMKSKAGESGSVLISLRIALWASMEATDILDGLTKAIMLGGDTDTYGAIAGGILGARFGVDGIPQNWHDVLIGGDKMIALADGLYDLAHA